MSHFRWGEEFLRINEEVLDAYTTCKSAGEVVEAQSNFLEKCSAEAESRRRLPQDRILPPESYSSESETACGESEEEKEIDSYGNYVTSTHSILNMPESSCDSSEQEEE